MDYDTGEFWLTLRARKAAPLWGYAAEIYRSIDGENFKLLTTVSKEEVASLANIEVLSIEGQQLIRDPFTGRYYFYLSVDVGVDPSI